MTPDEALVPLAPWMESVQERFRALACAVVGVVGATSPNREGDEMKPHCTHTEGPYHNCDYVNARNALIPIAERMADAAVSEGAKDWMWIRAFFAAMDKLSGDAFRRWAA